MIAEQLQAARMAHWRQQQPLLTLEDAQNWLGPHPLCLYLPRRAQLPAPAPSFVEACLGKPQTMPSPEAIAQAQALLTRLTANGTVVPLNLLGSLGEQPDFLATREALPFVLSLRGDADWKHAPQKSSGHKVSPLVLELWKLIESKDSITAAEARETLGRELTEAAVLRALAELWQGLRISPVYGEDGQPARWEMMRVRHREALTTAAATGQVTAISLLVSMYLQSVYAATSEEIEIFLSPVTSRSRVREAVRGLSATRQIHSLSMDAQTYYFLENGLPEFAAVAVTVEAELAPVAVRPKRREHPLAPAPGVMPPPARPEAPAPRAGWKSPQRASGDARPARPRIAADSSRRADAGRAARPGGFARAGAASRPRAGGEGRPPFKSRSSPPRTGAAGAARPWRPKTTDDKGSRPSTGGAGRPPFKTRSGPPRTGAAGAARPWRPKTTDDTGSRPGTGGAGRPPFKPRSGPPRTGAAGAARPWRPKTTDDTGSRPGTGGAGRPPFKSRSGPPRSGAAGTSRPWRPKTTDDKGSRPGTGGAGRPPFKPRSGPPRSGAAGAARPWRPKTTDDKGSRPGTGGAGRPPFKPRSGPPRAGSAGAPRPWRPKTTDDKGSRPGTGGAGRPPFKPRSGPPRGGAAGASRPWRPKTTDDKGSRPRAGGEGRPPFKPRSGPAKPRSGGSKPARQPGDYPRRKPDRKKPGA